ncbi:MAG: hypothetical protein A2270_01195 [Elusimicrobia bacterium RIFOXYA12_FULL_51_18]|nr:MAG: hypothetical protein A2270_01195 [Elusimicrobia bacterium RIFOXYA12_FULL_51_18]OGS31081.1 MAG: hypothetical protein A2218_01940 [Elusimicrobia bacterium RIFOXYA2_FULL_53_38]
MTSFIYRARLFILAALVSFFQALPVLAVSYPAPKGYVNDFAGVMDAGIVENLNNLLSDLDSRANAEVSVAVVTSLEGTDVETYATEMFKRWGVGHKSTNRGLLLLVSVTDRKSRIEVGYGLEGILPDGLTGAIQDKYMVPYFRQGDYSKGISQGTLAIAGIIAKDSGIELSAGSIEDAGNIPPRSRLRNVFSIILFIFFIILVIRHPFLLLLLLNTGRSGGYGGFGGGGFGGFGGGLSGGGGSSRSW